MSYEIIYEKFCTRIPVEAVKAQAREFLTDKLSIATSELSDRNVEQKLYERYRLSRLNDLLSLHMLCGSNNVTDANGRRTRDWQFYGIDEESDPAYHLVRKHAI